MKLNFIRIFFYLIPLFCVFLNNAQAATFTGTELLEYCQMTIKINESSKSEIAKISSKQLTDLAACVSYLQGIIDTQYAYSNEYKIFCLPNDDVKMSQAIGVVTKYLSSHPERLHEPAINMVLEALHASFPCKKETNTSGVSLNDKKLDVSQSTKKEIHK